MSIPATHRGKSAPGSGGPSSGRRPCRHPALRHIIPLAGAAGLIILVSACASIAPRPASATGARAQHTTASAVAVSLRPPAATASRPAPAASPAARATGITATGYTGPHFTTPQAAMSYLAAAYNNDDTTAMHAVTGPEAFTSLQAMRSSYADLQLTSCRPTPRGGYVCSFRYDYLGGRNPGLRTAMVIAAPALNPGWYMYRFIYGCD